MSTKNQNNKKEKKESLIIGALTGAAGIFITKVLGLIYVSPLNAMAQGETAFYSYAYTVYDYALTVTMSGVPYAIATLVAEYMAKDDKATVLLVKKLSKMLVSLMGVSICALMIIFSKYLALGVLPTNLTDMSYVDKTQAVIIIISFAMITVPILGFYRGYYQGLKDMKVYAFTQVIEQAVRVGFLLAAGAICVYLLNMERIWAVYMAVASAAISAAVCIIYFYFYDKRCSKEMQLDDVGESTHSKKEIFKELISYAVPYLLGGLINNASGVINLFFTKNGYVKFGYPAEYIVTITGLVNFECGKLVSIPQIIATSFGLAIIPHIAEAYAQNDEQKVNDLIAKALKTVFYLSILTNFWMCIFGTEIYYLMYGDYELSLGANLLKAMLISYLLWVPIVVMGPIIVTQGKKKSYVIIGIVSLILDVFTLPFWVSRLGKDGYFINLILNWLITAAIMVYVIKKSSSFDMKSVFVTIGQSLIAVIPMLILKVILVALNIQGFGNGRLSTLIYLFVCGVVCVGEYVFVTSKFKLPQQLLGLELSKQGIKNFISNLKG